VNLDRSSFKIYIYIYIIIINRDYTRDESKGGNGQTLTPTLIISAN